MKRTHLIILIVLLVLCAAGFYLWHTSAEDTAQALESYRLRSFEHLQAAYVPGVPENQSRERLNTILASVLVRPLTPDERRSLAEEGLAALKEVETQIDAIGEAGDRVQIALAYLEEKGGGIMAGDETKELIAAAKDEFAIIADIRGLSYRANFHTAEIFNRILLDGGELTSAYSKSLNDELPLVEEQFNTRAALYERLKDARARVDLALVALGEVSRD